MNVDVYTDEGLSQWDDAQPVVEDDGTLLIITANGDDTLAEYRSWNHIEADS